MKIIGFQSKANVLFPHDLRHVKIIDGVAVQLRQDRAGRNRRCSKRLLSFFKSRLEVIGAGQHERHVGLALPQLERVTVAQIPGTINEQKAGLPTALAG